MNKSFILSILIVFIFLLSGCAPEVQELQKQIEALETTIAHHEQENDKLKNELNNCNTLADTLDSEKKSRVEDLTSLKIKTRLFIKNEYDTLNTFSHNKELMDYMGGELITRKNLDGSNLTVINQEPFPADSVVYTIRGIFKGGTVFVPQLFRPSDGKFICVWQGPLVEVVSSGPNSYNLDTPLNTSRGDIFGYYFPKEITVTYDSRTGNYGTVNGKIELGQELPKSYNDENRNYSIGVSGFIN